MLCFITMSYEYTEQRKMRNRMCKVIKIVDKLTKTLCTLKKDQYT